MRFLRLLFANLKRHKLRTVLTVLSIIVAFILYAYLAAIRHAFTFGVSVAGADRLIVRNRISLIQPLPQAYQQQIEQVDGVALTTQASWFGGIYKDPKNNFPQISVQPELFLKIYPEYKITPADLAAWQRTRTGAVAGAKIAERFGWKVGDKIPIQATYQTPKGGGNLWTFDLVAIYRGATPEIDESTFFFRHDYLDENRMRGEGLTGWYYIKIKDPQHAEDVVKRIDDKFANSPYETKTETEKAFIKGFVEQTGNVGAIIMAILGAVFFTILLVAGNTMGQAVRERINELGVLKAIGFTDAHMLVLVLTESLLIAGFGGLVGLGIGWLLISGGDPTHGYLPVFTFPPTDRILGFVFVVALGLIAGALPALQAMRLNAVDALRRE